LYSMTVIACTMSIRRGHSPNCDVHPQLPSR
jgi:hypothetical protein